MNNFDTIKQDFYTYIQSTYNLTHEQLKHVQFQLNTDPAKQQFGDINCNIAMVCCKHVQKNPRAFAQEITEQFTHTYIDRMEIAGPGFLNLFFTPDACIQLAQQSFTLKNDFFKPTITPQKINIEFVSANPTGPLHFGHGRNGILGDALAKILTFLGHDITKEFYINDAGSQIQKLGNSLKIRCQQAVGKDVELPEDAYHGNYLQDMAHDLITREGASIIDRDIAYFSTYAHNYLLDYQKETLQQYKIDFDVWFSEKTLHDDNKVAQAIKTLKATGYTYEQEDALWFKSTEFGDDKDRVLIKSDGQYTYVSADIAYLLDKLNRGFDQLVMVLGHDHHSYVTRLHAIMQALGYDPARLHVILYQLVHVFKDGQPLRMSKRAGRIVGLRDIIQDVGTDKARFFYINKKAEAELEFDIDLALKNSNDNPVYYIQYAYVRTKSIMRKAAEHKDLACISAEDIVDLTEQEQLLIKKVASLKELLANINRNYQTHLLASYTYELAQLFNSYYNTTKAITEDIDSSKNRLALVHIVQQTFEVCLHLMDVSAPERM